MFCQVVKICSKKLFINSPTSRSASPFMAAERQSSTKASKKHAIVSSRRTACRQLKSIENQNQQEAPDSIANQRGHSSLVRKIIHNLRIGRERPGKTCQAEKVMYDFGGKKDLRQQKRPSRRKALSISYRCSPWSKRGYSPFAILFRIPRIGRMPALGAKVSERHRNAKRTDGESPLRSAFAGRQAGGTNYAKYATPPSKMG